jgi:hypothetical protein
MASVTLTHASSQYSLLIQPAAFRVCRTIEHIHLLDPTKSFIHFTKRTWMQRRFGVPIWPFWNWPIFTKCHSTLLTPLKKFDSRTHICARHISTLLTGTVSHPNGRHCTLHERAHMSFMLSLNQFRRAVLEGIRANLLAVFMTSNMSQERFGFGALVIFALLLFILSTVTVGSVDEWD